MFNHKLGTYTTMVVRSPLSGSQPEAREESGVRGRHNFLQHLIHMKLTNAPHHHHRVHTHTHTQGSIVDLFRWLLLSRLLLLSLSANNKEVNVCYQRDG